MIWIKTRQGYIDAEKVEAFTVNGLGEVHAHGAEKVYPVKKFDNQFKAEQYVERLIERVNAAHANQHNGKFINPMELI